MTLVIPKSVRAKFSNAAYPTLVVEAKYEGPSGDTSHWKEMFENKSEIDLAKDFICRVCGKNGCTPLLDKLEDGYDILSAIRSMTHTIINMDDSLPKFICYDCLNTLKVAFAFKKTCEASDKKFKKMLNPDGDPSLHSYPYSKNDFNQLLHQMKLKRIKVEEMQEKKRKKREKIVDKKKTIISKDKNFRCTTCDITFNEKEQLLEHRRERQCMRRTCDICGQLVLSITQHRRLSHHVADPYRCSTCGKEFAVLARLKSHMTVHTDSFNYFCDLCPYKSKQKYYLVTHMRTHTGEKPYKCSECPATFVNPSNLNKHKLIHQEKQCVCTWCGKSFRTNAALKEHREAVHMHIKHSCTQCGRDFCYKSDLRKHEIKVHNREKRDYVGGEPAYKQVERMQRQDDGTIVDRKYTQLNDPSVIACTGMYDEEKGYIYYEVPPLTALQPADIVPQQQQQGVQIISDMATVKKDESKLYETPPNIGFY